MELHILEHRLRVASIAKESIQLFTYGLIKLAFLSSKTRVNHLVMPPASVKV